MTTIFERNWMCVVQNFVMDAWAFGDTTPSHLRDYFECNVATGTATCKAQFRRKPALSWQEECWNRSQHKDGVEIIRKILYCKVSWPRSWLWSRMVHWRSGWVFYQVWLPYHRTGSLGTHLAIQERQLPSGIVDDNFFTLRTLLNGSFDFIHGRTVGTSVLGMGWSSEIWLVGLGAGWTFNRVSNLNAEGESCPSLAVFTRGTRRSHILAGLPVVSRYNHVEHDCWPMDYMAPSEWLHFQRIRNVWPHSEPCDKEGWSSECSCFIEASSRASCTWQVVFLDATLACHPSSMTLSYSGRSITLVHKAPFGL